MESKASGYLEAAYFLENPAKEFNVKELLDAATAAQLRNTGWPIGIVLNGAGLAPVPTADGIEAKITTDRHFDHWSLGKDARFYFLRRLEEDVEKLTNISPPPPDYVIWWDVRVWRIAEVFLHCTRLFRSLGISPDAKVTVSLNHTGLMGRALYNSRPFDYFTSGTKICHASEAKWQRSLTPELIESGLSELVFQVAYELVVLFEFMELSRETVQQVVERFLNSRL